MVIYALVEASTHDALATGKTVFDRLVGSDPHSCAVFNSYVTFDEKDTTVAGKARWGDLLAVAPRSFAECTESSGFDIYRLVVKQLLAHSHQD